MLAFRAISCTVLIPILHVALINSDSRIRLKLDMIVIVDESYEKTADQWSTVKNDMLTLPFLLDMSPNYALVAVVAYATEARILLNFTANASRFNEAIGRLHAVPGPTELPTGLEKVVELLIVGRIGVPKAVVLISNKLSAKSALSATAAADKLRQTAAALFLLYLDRTTDDMAMREHLLRLTGNSWQVFQRRGAKSFKVMLQQLALRECSMFRPVCRFASKRQQCVEEWWRMSEPEHCPNVTTPVAAVSTCQTSDCERVCDQLWPWTPDESCVCGQSVGRHGDPLWPGLLRNCPQKQPCQRCAVSSASAAAAAAGGANGARIVVVTNLHVSDSTDGAPVGKTTEASATGGLTIRDRIDAHGESIESRNDAAYARDDTLRISSVRDNTSPGSVSNATEETRTGISSTNESSVGKNRAVADIVDELYNGAGNGSEELGLVAMANVDNATSSADGVTDGTSSTVDGGLEGRDELNDDQANKHVKKNLRGQHVWLMGALLAVAAIFTTMVSIGHCYNKRKRRAMKCQPDTAHLAQVPVITSDNDLPKLDSVHSEQSSEKPER